MAHWVLDEIRKEYSNTERERISLTLRQYDCIVNGSNGIYSRTKEIRYEKRTKRDGITPNSLPYFPSKQRTTKQDFLSFAARSLYATSLRFFRFLAARGQLSCQYKQQEKTVAVFVVAKHSKKHAPITITTATKPRPLLINDKRRDPLQLTE